MFRTMIVAALAVAANLALVQPALAAPSISSTGYITFLAGGWTSPNVRITMDFAFYNPASCSNTDGYMTDTLDSGINLFNSMLLSAFMARRKISIVVDGCTQGRPRIIGVNILP